MGHKEAFIDFNYSQVKKDKIGLKRLIGKLYTASEQLKKLREEKEREIAELKKKLHDQTMKAQRLDHEVAVLKHPDTITAAKKEKKYAEAQLLIRPAKNITAEQVTVDGVKYWRGVDERIIDYKTGSPWGTYDAKKKTVTFEKRKLKLHERRKK